MRLARAAAACVVLSLLVACERAPSEPRLDHRPRASPTSANTLVIGLVATLSGPDAWRGEDAFEGADLAVQVLNRLRDPGTPRFELVTLDDGGSAERAGTLVRELAESNRTMGIVYAGPPLGLPSAASILEGAGIPALLCHGDLFSAGLLRGNLFQMSTPYLWEARKLVGYATGDRQYRRLGLLAPKGPEGLAAVRSTRAAIAEVRPARLVIARYAGSDAGLDEALRSLERGRVSALVVDGSAPVAERVFDLLRDHGNGYSTTRAARVSARAGAPWRPQVLAFDPAIAPIPPGGEAFIGSVSSDTYARGSALLRVPSFVRFRSSFREWWSQDPVGWQQRAYDATRLVGWGVAESTSGRAGVAAALETIDGQRFGGSPITFTRTDHVAVDATTVGLWTIPRPRAPGVGERPESFPWVPLARGFAVAGRTHIPAEDWTFLFRGRTGSRPPTFRAFRQGVTSPRSDPVH